MVKTEFYNEIKTYLASLVTNPNNIKSLEDIVDWNAKHSDIEGGKPNTHPAWPSGQDNFELSLAWKGRTDETYHKALEFIRQKSREDGIDAALRHPGGHLDGLLVPLQAENGASSQLAAKAGSCSSPLRLASFLFANTS